MQFHYVRAVSLAENFQEPEENLLFPAGIKSEVGLNDEVSGT
jgi:hypothetical protein